MKFITLEKRNTEADERISSYLNAQKDKVIKETMMEISKKINVSPSTITKYLQRCGYDGWKDYTNYLYTRVSSNKYLPKKNDDNRMQIQKIKNMNYIDTVMIKQIHKIIKLIDKNKKIILIGHGATKSLLKLYKRNLRVLDYDCDVVDMSDKYASYKNKLSIIYFVVSISGKNSYLKNIREKMKKCDYSTRILISASNIYDDVYDMNLNNKSSDINYEKIENAVPIISTQFIQHIYDQILFGLVRKNSDVLYKRFEEIGVIKRIKKT